jgi:hypothetical protein
MGSDAASAAQSRRGGRVAGARRVRLVAGRAAVVVVSALAAAVLAATVVVLAVFAGALAVFRAAGSGAAVGGATAASPVFAFRVSFRGFPKIFTNLQLQSGSSSHSTPSSIFF